MPHEVIQAFEILKEFFVLVCWSSLDDVVKTFFFSQFTNEAVESPDHKTHHSFSVKCLWNVQIQILNLPKRPS